MGEFTSIGWCHFTFNPWIGCSPVSLACSECYAAKAARRWKGRERGIELWKRRGPRQVTSASYWHQPVRWDKARMLGSEKYRVFAASQADVFENRRDLDELRARLFTLYAATPNLVWMNLTKRIEDVPDLVPWGEDWPGNVWLGTSVESQRYADTRVDALRRIPAKVRFLSVEPLVEPVRLNLDGIHLVIVGGMSGPKHARYPLQAEWVRSVRDQCADAGTAFFFKQWGGLHPKDGGKVLDGREWCEFPDEPRLVAA